MNKSYQGSIATLSAEEVGQVSGAGFFGSLFGSVLHTANVAVNTGLNTPLISSVGLAFNQLGPVGTAIHVAADTGGYLVFQGVEAVATAVGGTQEPVPYHYNTEWA
ncbi:MAG: hypothetical protein EOP20_02185 [Hyphomicrobiales bacterium]|nr:MAG: hypothetical protein EOP20_02185 [Hyphomicrobiales bacterium]